jgi:hypothetical protein
MNKPKYKLKAVAEMLDVSRDRITYTLKNGFLPPRKRRYLHHWYSLEEIILLADYFDVPIPKALEQKKGRQSV